MYWPAIVWGTILTVSGALLWRFARNRPDDSYVSQPEGMSSVPGIMYGGRADNPRMRLMGFAWLMGGLGLVLFALGLIAGQGP